MDEETETDAQKAEIQRLLTESDKLRADAIKLWVKLWAASGRRPSVESAWSPVRPPPSEAEAEKLIGAPAALIDELERALKACSDVAAGEQWPGGEFAASVEGVLRQYIGRCGHFTHDGGCQCENDD